MFMGRQGIFSKWYLGWTSESTKRNVIYYTRARAHANQNETWQRWHANQNETWQRWLDLSPSLLCHVLTLVQSALLPGKCDHRGNMQRSQVYASSFNTTICVSKGRRCKVRINFVSYCTVCIYSFNDVISTAEDIRHRINDTMGRTS
jgi:hypothetical protein